LLWTWKQLYGSDLVAVVPIALGMVSLVGAVRARSLWPVEDPVRDNVLVGFLAVALAFAAVAIPLQLQKEWITVGWALEGAALLALWRRFDHRGLKYFALSLLAAVCVRLLVNPHVLGYHPRGAMRLLNWLSYAYLVPAAALLLSSRLLKDLELGRLRGVEKLWFKNKAGTPVMSAATMFAAVAVIFAWLNLTVSDLFGSGSELVLSIADRPMPVVVRSFVWTAYALALLALAWRYKSRGLQRVSLGLFVVTAMKVFAFDRAVLDGLDLTSAAPALKAAIVGVTVGWGVYALVLLAYAVAVRSRPLRWMSMLATFGTLFKLTLYDLSELQGMARVLILAGLAVVMFLISLAYSKLVFRSEAPDPEQAKPEADELGADSERPEENSQL